MRKLIGILLIILPAVTFSQQLVNGFGVEVFTGSAYKSTEPIKFCYNGELNSANNITNSKVHGGSLTIPFDIGVKRHRFTFAPGFEYRDSKLFLSAQYDLNGSYGTTVLKDQISLKSTTYSPMVFVAYRPHFYLGRLHMSFCIGAGIKYLLINNTELVDNDQAQLIKYDAKVTSGENFLDLSRNASAQILANKGLNIDPRIGLDFYFNNSFMISLFAIIPDAQSIGKTKSIAIEFGGGITYLIKTNKISEAKILQQYKK